jgi:hypothetical protein
VTNEPPTVTARAVTPNTRFGDRTPVSVVYPLPPEETRVVQLVEKALAQTKTKKAVKVYTTRGRRFIHWCLAHGIKWRDGTAKDVATFVQETWPGAEATRKIGTSCVEKFLRYCSAGGIPCKHFPARSQMEQLPAPIDAAPVDLPNPFRFDSRSSAPATPTSPQTQQQTQETTSAPAVAQPTPATMVTFAPREPPLPQQRRAAPPAQQPAAQRIAAARSLLPSGGQFLISRRATAADAAVTSVGNPIHIGRYFPQDVAAYGSIEHFLDRCIVPTYVKPGGPSVVFLVDHEDDRGNKTRVGVEYPYDAPMATTPASNTGSGAQPQGMHTAQGTYGAPPVDSRLASVEAEYQRLAKLTEMALGKLSAGNTSDPSIKSMQDILDMQRVKLEGDLQRLNETLERERREREERERRDRETATQLAAMSAAMPATPQVMPTEVAAAPKTDAMVDALVRLTERITQPQPPAPQPAAPDPLAMMQAVATLMQTLAPKPPVIDPIVQRILDEQREAMKEMKEAAREAREKTSSPFGEFGDAIKAIKDVVGLKSVLADSGPPESVWPALIDALAPHADKIGLGLQAVVAGLTRAPQLVVPPQQQQQSPAQQQAPTPGPSTVPPMPPQMAPLLREMGTAVEGVMGDQLILDKLFELLPLFAPAPLQPIGDRILKAFVRANSKPELRALVTNLCKLTNDGTLLDNATIARITDALHRNYSVLFAHLSDGKQKILADATPTPSSSATTVTTTTTAATPPSAASDSGNGAANGKEEEEEEEEDAEEEEADDAGAPQ